MRAARRILRWSLCRVWFLVYRVLGSRLRRSGYSQGPRSLLIQLTYSCNLRCWFCNQWGSTGIYKELPSAELRKTLPLSALTKLLDELPLTCGVIMLWGGETLQYPELIPLIRHIKKSGFGCSLITNGTTLAKKALDLIAAGVDVVHVSIDATEETHDRFRGAKGTYTAAMEGIRQLQTVRSARRRRKPKIGVGCTVIPAAVDELGDLVRAVRLGGADYITINKVSYTTERLGQAHDRVFQNLFQIQPKSWKGFVRPEGIDGAPRVKAALEQLRADPSNKDFVMFENERTWQPEDWFQYYTDPRHVAPRERSCGFPWDSVCIYPNGDASPCPDFPDYVVGNVLTQSFPEIWNGASYRKFRDTLSREGRFPICSLCCHLYDE